MRCVYQPLDFLDLARARGLAGIYLGCHCGRITLLRRGKSHCIVLVCIFSTLIRIRKKRLVPICFTPSIKACLLMLLRSKSFHANLSGRGAISEADIVWTVRGGATSELVSVQQGYVPETSWCWQGLLIIS